MLQFYEFFCGGGMARAGLGEAWRCVFANDLSPKKAAAYRANYPDAPLTVGDVGALSVGDLPGRADLAWASFPCQDLSVAGGGRGLRGARSGAFWPFQRLLGDLRDEGRAPRMVALENVTGLLTNRKGADFVAMVGALAELDYRVGALVIDAKLFLPQSRPRLFLLAAQRSEALDPALLGEGPEARWSPDALLRAQAALPASTRGEWLWWRAPGPSKRGPRLSDVVTDAPVGVRWHSPQETERLLGLMNATNRAKVTRARRARRRIVGALYRRMRTEDGVRLQRAEVRFDELAGCLRTPAGGSSRQTILVVHGDNVRSRLIDAREAAALMGLPRRYQLPARYNEAYHLIGDGVAVDVVRHLSEHILRPALSAHAEADPTAATLTEGSKTPPTRRRRRSPIAV
ncbi:MAG: DNA cytosine methyltransferase [Pseudomonadota bacterium]